MKATILALLVCIPTCLLAQKFEGLAPTPPMGWNSWNTFEGKISEPLIKEMTDALIESGMQAAGYNYIVIDDGWEANERDVQGNLVPDPARFPNGMKALGDYIHARGFKFGIHNCAGTKTCAGLPGGRGHEFEDARTYASWGVDYLKYDWCILAAPLMAGNDVRKMPSEIRAILTDREVIAIDQDSLGKQGYQFMSHPGKEIWVKELSNKQWAVCFFNNSTDPVKLRVDWNHLSFLNGGACQVHDLWKKKDLGKTVGQFEASVPGRDVILLRLAPLQ